MSLTLRWRQPDPPLVLRWVGLTGEQAAAQRLNPAQPVAAVIGPSGPPGLYQFRVQESIDQPTVTPESGKEFIKVFGQSVPLTIANPGFTASEAHRLIIKIEDDGTSVPITWGSAYASFVSQLPNSTTSGKAQLLGFIYDTGSSKWQLVAYIVEL